MKFKVFRYKKVKSTNNTAIRIIRETNHNFGMIISETQTGGKGQYGRKWISYKGKLKGLKIAVWGLAFKPNTDDVRESPSIDLIKNLLSSGAKVFVHDPEAMDQFKKIIKSPNLKYCKKISTTTLSADALLLVTDWEEYLSYDFSKDNMKMNNMVCHMQKLILGKEQDSIDQ